MAQLVHLIGLQQNAQRAFFIGEDQRIVNYRVVYIPLFDSEAQNSKAVSLEFAREARNRWRDAFNIVAHVALTTDGEFVEDDVPTATSTGRDGRVPLKATLDGVTFYLVIPVRTPSDGACWCLRFDRPELANQTIFGPDAITVLRRAQDREILQFATPLPTDPAPQAPVLPKKLGPVLRPADQGR
jgi:hypothetical protein